jgi:hypothetical protein
MRSTQAAESLPKLSDDVLVDFLGVVQDLERNRNTLFDCNLRRQSNDDFPFAGCRIGVQGVERLLALARTSSRPG